MRPEDLALLLEQAFLAGYKRGAWEEWDDGPSPEPPDCAQFLRERLAALEKGSRR